MSAAPMGRAAQRHLTEPCRVTWSVGESQLAGLELLVRDLEQLQIWSLNT